MKMPSIYLKKRRHLYLSASEAFDKIQRQIQSFISINKSVSPQMVTFIEKLDFMFQVKILPLLETSLDAKTKYSQSVQERLFEIEQSVAIYLLQPQFYISINKYN